MPGFVVAPERFVVGICLGVRESHDSDSARIEHLGLRLHILSTSAWMFWRSVTRNFFIRSQEHTSDAYLDVFLFIVTWLLGFGPSSFGRHTFLRIPFGILKEIQSLTRKRTFGVTPRDRPSHCT